MGDKLITLFDYSCRDILGDSVCHVDILQKIPEDIFIVMTMVCFYLLPSVCFRHMDMFSSNARELSAL